MHLGKRGRPNATVKAEHAASKRQKVLGTFDAKPARQLPTGDQEPKTTRKHAGAADREAGLPGGPRVTSAVQPPPNGTITTTQTLTNGEAQPLIQVTATSAHTNGPQESDKRTLRSHDGGSRSKSELAQYFPNFDEIVSNERKEAELLTGSTRLYITEEPPRSPTNTSTPTFVLCSPPPPPSLRRSSIATLAPTSPQPKSRVPTPITCQKLDFTLALFQLPSTHNEDGSDPLPSSIYAKAHRRAERQEKQLRNIEKERAMHEKVQLERLLDGLHGPDWLRVMGISGIVEGERKNWEDKRVYFVKEVKALLAKFRLWKEEERRRKVERE
ncbi:MAG: hypothetical protein LQ340_003666, partial [Diploschistes diacapsis]